MKRAIVYVPGLGDHRSRAQRLAVGLWRLYGLRPSVIVLNWRSAEPFEQKKQRLLAEVDDLRSKGYQVSLVGVSAGAGAAVNAFAERQNDIHRVVCICGKLRNPASLGSVTFRRNPAFGESMQQLPASLHRLTPEATHRILSIRPRHDNRVPPTDTVIAGAQARTIPTSGHVVSIGLCITVFSWLIARFVRQT